MASAALSRATQRTRRLTAALAGLMTLQSSLGLAFHEQYRDVEWIRATWSGNDAVTVAVAVPLLLIGRARAATGSARGLLLVLGTTGYAAYNYAFYLFGAALNVFFPLYVASVLVAGVTLFAAFPLADAGGIASRFQSSASARVLGGYFVFVGTGLGAAWLAMWAAYIFLGRSTPVEPDAFRLVAALDLSVMVPLLIAGGTLMWRRRPWGVVVCAVAGFQASLYLLVLSVNAIAAIRLGLAVFPGELPVWGPLMVFTSLATTWLVLRVGDSRRGHR